MLQKIKLECNKRFSVGYCPFTEAGLTSCLITLLNICSIFGSKNNWVLKHHLLCTDIALLGLAGNAGCVVQISPIPYSPAGVQSSTFLCHWNYATYTIQPSICLLTVVKKDFTLFTNHRFLWLNGNYSRGKRQGSGHSPIRILLLMKSLPRV